MVGTAHEHLCPPYETTTIPLIIPASIKSRLKCRASAPALQA